MTRTASGQNGTPVTISPCACTLLRQRSPPDTSRPHLDARWPDPSIEHGEDETLSVLRHLLLSSPRELLEELRPTVSSILLCCCYMTGGVLSSERTNVHPHSPLPPIHMFIYCTFYFVFRAYSRSLPRTLSQMHTHLLVVCFIISRQTVSTLLVLLHTVCADHFLIYLFYQMWVGAGFVEVQS